MPSRITKNKRTTPKAGRAMARTTRSKPSLQLHSVGAAAQTIRVQGHVAASVRRKQAKRDSR